MFSHSIRPVDIISVKWRFLTLNFDVSDDLVVIPVYKEFPVFSHESPFVFSVFTEILPFDPLLSFVSMAFCGPFPQQEMHQMVQPLKYFPGYSCIEVPGPPFDDWI